MRRTLIVVLIASLILFLGGLYFVQFLNKDPQIEKEQISKEAKSVVGEEGRDSELVNPPQKIALSQTHFVAQTFNNCGPASLSMVMSILGKNVSQNELAEKMRPFNNPQGGVDDKSIFATEFVTTASEYGFESLHRPNGSIKLLQKFTANEIPVVVRTWLNPEEDIGHFRVVRGYDESTKTILQDDSYQGPNLSYSYAEFEKMWQPFNYGYIVVYSKDKQKIVEKILGEEMKEEVAWENALQKAEKELKENAADHYAQFNISVANYYLGNYDRSIVYYEMARSQLPPRMLWYQYEPLQSYMKKQQYEKLFELSDDILNNGNQAYSELYLLRGQSYLEQGRVDDAQAEFEKAVFYNKNSKEAQTALNKVL